MSSKKLLGWQEKILLPVICFVNQNGNVQGQAQMVQMLEKNGGKIDFNTKISCGTRWGEMTGMLLLESWEIDKDFTKNNIDHEQAHEITKTNQGEVPHTCSTEHTEYEDAPLQR